MGIRLVRLSNGEAFSFRAERFIAAFTYDDPGHSGVRLYLDGLPAGHFIPTPTPEAARKLAGWIAYQVQGSEADGD